MRKAQLESDEEEAAQEAQQELMKKQVKEKLTLLNSDDNDQLEEQQEQVSWLHLIDSGLCKGAEFGTMQRSSLASINLSGNVILPF